MAGINDTDIRLDANWQLTAETNGETLLVSGVDCFIQSIQLEALTQEGELFYDESWGWSLLDFIQSQDDELTRLEIGQRVKTKLAQRSEIDGESIEMLIRFDGDYIQIQARFKLVNVERELQLDIGLDRVKVEVILI